MASTSLVISQSINKTHVFVGDIYEWNCPVFCHTIDPNATFPNWNLKKVEKGDFGILINVSAFVDTYVTSMVYYRLTFLDNETHDKYFFSNSEEEVIKCLKKRS